jgi:hypothetical protein
MSSSITYVLQQYYEGDQIKEDGMVGTYSTHWSDERYIKNLVGKPAPWN